MNGNMQQQQNEVQHLTGLISNLRKVTTKTGKPMAVFTIGGTPAKCFDLTVDQAAHWADTGKEVSINGQFSSHQGQIEFVAQNIGLAAQGQADAQVFPEIAAANRAPIRESSTILQNLSGCVSDMRAIPTRSGRAMITFKIANTPCKALGDLASAIQKAQGKQIEISARKGTFRGMDEYAVEILKSISGTAVNLSRVLKNAEFL